MQRKKLKEFKKEVYYSTLCDPDYDDMKKALYIELKGPGKQLISEYYAAKYRACILILPTEKDFLREIKEDKDIARARREKLSTYRKAFIIGGDDHSKFAAYLRENQQEAFLFADSIGSNDYALSLYEEHKITTYISDAERQSDVFSCHTDALVLGRDITAKVSGEEGYRLPDLLLKIQSRSKEKYSYFTEDELIYSALLPNELLKTAQKNSFMAIHEDKDDKDRPIHKGQSLSVFRKRYEREASIFSKKAEAFIVKKRNAYLKEKGIKYADIIEIQFYIHQMKEIGMELWTDAVQKSFVQEAKKFLQAQVAEASAAEHASPLDIIYLERAGLHHFAQAFLNQLLKKSEEKLMEAGPAPAAGASVSDSLLEEEAPAAMPGFVKK